VLERSLKESEKLSSGGIVPRACCGNRPGRDSNQEKLMERKESSRRRIRRPGIAVENREIPLTVGSGEVARDLTLKRRKNPAHRISAFGFDEARVACSLKSRVAISESTGAVDQSRDTWRKIPRSRGSALGVFDNRENLHRGSAIREIPKVTWQRGTPGASGTQVALHRAIVSSGFGGWNSKLLTSQAAIS
jgi:hypothetical protein